MNKIKPTMSMQRMIVLLVAILGVAYVLSYFLSSLLPDIMRVSSLLFLGVALMIVVMGAGKVMGPFPTLASFDNAAGMSIAIVCAKTCITFIVFMIAYWGINASGFLYQPVSYNDLNQPVTFVPSTSQAWEMTLKLGLAVWLIAATLALGMGMLKTTTLSGVATLFNLSAKYKNLAWLMDGAIVGCLLVAMMFILVVAITEGARSIFNVFNIAQPIYPQIISFFIGFAIYAVYVAFKIKQRLLEVSKKTVSLSAMLLLQSSIIFIAVLAGSIILMLLPDSMTESLLKPMRNILFFNASFGEMGLLAMTTMGLAMTPLLGAYLAQLWEGVAVRKVASVLLILPFLGGALAQAMLGEGFNLWAPMTNLALMQLITEQNILYQVGSAQLGILCTTIILLVALSGRTRLQESLVGLVPHHIGRRLNRVCGWLARSMLLFIIITWAYTTIGLPTFYYISTYVFWLVMVGVSIMIFSGFMYECKHRSSANNLKVSGA